MRRVTIVMGMLVMGGVLSVAPIGLAQSVTTQSVTTIVPPAAVITYVNGTSAGSTGGSPSCAEDDQGARAQNKQGDEAESDCDDDEGGSVASSSPSVVVGFYNDGRTDHSFQWTGGIFSSLDLSTASWTRVLGINGAGHIVGYYGDLRGVHGFLLVVGTPPTTIDAATYVPGANWTFAMGVNATDQVVGYYYDSSWQIHGFVLAGGTFTTLNFPGGVPTYATGINNGGQVVGYAGFYQREQGWLCSASPCVQAGRYSLSGIPVTGSYTKANGISTASEVVGEYKDSTNHVHGFRLSATGVMTTVDISGSSGTMVNGINDLGEVVGEYLMPVPNCQACPQAQLGFKMP